jgi:hypothetical protein
MNREEAVSTLHSYQACVKRAQDAGWGSKDRRAAVRELNEMRPRVNAFMHDLAPDIKLLTATSLNDHVAALPRVSRALAIIATWDAVEAENDVEDLLLRPVLPLMVLDELVAHRLEPLWGNEKYRSVVHDAASRLNVFTQNRLGRHDVSDTVLMAQAFSLDKPEPGKPRLRCPGNLDNQTVRSMQQGALMFSQGVFMAIRNPAAHLTGDWNPVTAAEHLAALSIVTRWVRHWDVLLYVPPAPALANLQAPLVAAPTKTAPKAKS